jgi:hypothetical protein
MSPAAIKTLARPTAIKELENLWPVALCSVRRDGRRPLSGCTTIPVTRL